MSEQQPNRMSDPGAQPEPTGFIEWLRRQNMEFRQAMERRESKLVIEYMAMFCGLFPDASLDQKNASWELADAFYNTAAVLTLSGDHAKADSFASRALAIKHALDRPALEEMIAKPMVIPDVVLPDEGFFGLLHRDIVAGIWQSANLPNQTLAWEVVIDQPWRYLASRGDLMFWQFDLESTEKDEQDKREQTGRDMFLRMAKNPSFRVYPDRTGDTVRAQVICRGAIRVQRSAPGQSPKWILVGWYLARLLPPETKS
jgi:hypothetical protein